MLHLSLLVVFIGICVGLAMGGTWDRPNIWTVAIAVICVVVGALLEALRFERAKTVTRGQKALSRPSSRHHSQTVQAGYAAMLLAASYFLLGLILLMFQVMAYFLG